MEFVPERSLAERLRDGRILPPPPRSEGYSLGPMLYETLTGRSPFRAATPPTAALAATSKHPRGDARC